MKESLKFYNRFDSKLIQDYAKANKRIKNAIESLAQFILPDQTEILDIGCGLGWSTYEFSRFFKSSNFQGIDISPVLIDKAQKLFNNKNLNYKTFDVLENIPDKKFDVIVMIDVYEHIPLKNRIAFHESLNALLKDNGRIILACPSIYHQKYLKKYKPEGLQPVDEDVSLSDLNIISKDINGELIYFEYKSIWRTYDYFYAVIQKSITYDSNLKIRSDIEYNIENKSIRLKKLKNNLGIDIPKKKSSQFVRKIIKKLN